MTLFVGGALGVAAQERGTVPSRRIIRYDSEVQLHDVDPGIVLPDQKKDKSRGADASSTVPGSGRDARLVPSPFKPIYLPPPPVPAPDPKKRNWIIPTLDGESEPRVEEEKEETGWGWLADDLSQKREKAAEDKNKEEESSDWLTPMTDAQRDTLRPPSTLGTPGARLDNLFMSPLHRDGDGRERVDSVVSPLIEDHSLNGGKSRERSLQNQPVIRDTESMERATRNGYANEAYPADDPTLVPAPWDSKSATPAPWTPTTAYRAQEDDFTSRYGVNQAGAIPSPVFTPTRSTSLSPSSLAGDIGTGSSRFDSLSPSFESGTARIEARFETSSPVGNGAFASTPWRTDWSHDTDWKSAGQEPVRSPSLSASPITPAGFNRGWLADPVQ